jgi:hypothetical protein
MKHWKELNYEERERIETLFNSGEKFEVELFSEEPRIIFEDGTTVFIEGILEN